MTEHFLNSTGSRRRNGAIRLLSVAIGLLCAGSARAQLEAAPLWAESEPLIRFESRDWAEPVLAAAINNPAMAVEGGRLQSSITWTADKTHLVFNTVYVPNGVTLTIGAGAVVKYCPGTTIKVEDGGKLSVVGADGSDVILTAANDDSVGDAVAGFEDGQSIAFEGMRLQSSAATFTDNGCLETRGFSFGSFPGVLVNGTEAVRNGGVAYVPFTLSGASRNTAFSVDWEAVAGTATFGEDYTLASGRILWGKSDEGTKTLQIPLNAGNITGEERIFTVRIRAAHCANIVRGEATVRIVERDGLTLDWADEWAESEPPIRFESRDWAEPVLAAATNSPSIAVEGGRLQLNTIWDASKTHLVFNTVYVPSGVTLTIGAGAVVKYCPGMTIKVEDGGKLSVVGADGSDVILTAASDDSVGETVAGFESWQTIAFDGIRLQSTAASFTDNGYLQTRGFSYGNYPGIYLNDATAFRSSGEALVPVTIGGATRNQSFNVDWVAEDISAKFGEDYTLASGRITWSKSGDGTKTLSIPLVADHIVGSNTTFRLRLTVSRGANIARATCIVTIKELDNLNIESASAESEPPIRFESRDWAEPVLGAATNSPSIAVEGGRLQSNTTWIADKTHLVFNTVYVPNGVTLTIGAGAVVKCCPGTTIKVEDGGKLSVVGADGSDVILTAANDDSVGETVTGFEPGQTIAFDGIRLQSTAASFTDNGWMQMRGVSFGNYPTLTLHDAVANRKSGMIYLPVTVGGSTRNQGFSVDWAAEDGTAEFGRDYTERNSGRLTWSKSGDGSKYITIPLMADDVAGSNRTFTVKISAARACNIARDAATATIADFSNGGITDLNVVESAPSEPSPEFPVHEGIKSQPMFLNDVETIQYSGKWQPYDADEAATLRVTLGTDNGMTVLKECAPSETGAFDLDLTRYPVGLYTLKHEILDAYGETLATMQKVFSIADEEDVVLHGGVLASNEVWTADKVHVVYQTVIVPSIHTILIEPGAIVKFMTGTGIDISQGGAFFANRIVFTHINDDTVGGDTLSDGFTIAPPMDAYFLRGAFTFGDDTELRGITQNTALSGTVSTQKTLSRGSTYRVSGTVTVAAGGKLTIPPGTVLKMEAGASIVVNSGATLNALGTRAAPIVITSIRDDSVSGDTNGDGGATIPQPGDWVKIGVNGGTANFEFTKILYSSKNQTTGAINMNGGKVVFSNGEISHGLYDAVGVEAGNFYMTNSVISDCLLAFRHWARDPIVNSIIYDCGRLTQGGGQHFVNCIFSNIDEAWEAFGFPQNGTTYQNCVFWNEGGSVLTAEGIQDAMAVCGKDGNIWGDPLFVDPENGDFRIFEGSPCVDAADGAVAPEFDYFGQPRVTITDTTTNLVGQLADIGICEVMPRNVAADIDLVPQSVRTVTNAVPGQLLFVKWEVANRGGVELADAAWRDTILLVSAYGREVELGEKISSGSIAAGGSLFCSGYFTVPALAEGMWYPKVNVNSHHDVFEGSLAANNALTGDRGVEVALESLDPSVSRDGVVNAGVPTVLKLTFPDGADNRMVKLGVPAGVKVTYGFGFMPQGASKSGATTATRDGVMFRVPDDATDVYVVLESDKTGTYSLSTESTKVVITAVTPPTLPSSGTTTLTISGAGFGDECAVSLLNAVGSYRVPLIAKDAIGNLVATVDCAALTAGQTYAVRVESGDNAAELPGAVSVMKVEGKGILELEYDVPSSVRPGRVFSFTVTYRNVGNKDLCVPLLTVQDTGNDTKNPIQFSLDGERFTPGGFQFVGNDAEGGFGPLHPGDEVTLHVTAKIPPANNGSTAISVRANTESDLMSKYTTEVDRYLTPAMKAEFATTTDAELKARGERLVQVFGANNGEMVRNFAALAAKFVECNGFVLQKVDDLVLYGVAVVKAGDETSGYSKEAVITAFNNVASPKLRGSDRLYKENVSIYDPHYEEVVDWNGYQTVKVLLRYTTVVDADTDLYVWNGVWKRISEVNPNLGIGKIAILCHGFRDDINSGWMGRMAEALQNTGKFTCIVGINWGREAFRGQSIAYVAKAAANIYPVADFMKQELVDHYNWNPSSTTFIGHSFGSHLTGLISGGRGVRHIGLDTAALTPMPKRCQIGGGCAQQTEYYRSSLGSGRNDAYANFNYIVANRNSFEFNISHPFAAFDDDHSYSHEWFIFNIMHGQSSGIGFWSDHGLPAPNGSCLAMNTSGYIGVIDGSRDVLECTYKFGEEGFMYPGNKSGWNETHYAWLNAVDIETTANMADGTEVEADKKFAVGVTGKDNADIETLTRDYDYRLDVSFVRNDGQVTSLISDDQQASGSFNKNLKIPESVIPENMDKVDGKLVFTIIAGKMYYCWVSHNEMYMPDNTDEVEITVKRSGLPSAVINGEDQDGFTLHQEIVYASQEEYDAAVKNGDTFSYTFDGSGSKPGKKRKITSYSWGASSITRSYSATSSACYPISLTVCNDINKEDTVSGQLDVSVVIRKKGDPIEQPKSYDPNEMVGELGLGDPDTERQLVPGEWATYTIYFENQTNATAAAQEVYVSEALNANLDWSTFEMAEVAFGDQIDLGLAGKKNGSSDATMEGTNLIVRTSLALDETTGLATWYMRIVDPTTDTGWPKDILAGFLPPNDPDTHCGEGHITYRVKVREDAVPGSRIDASASIVFDYNEPIITDPAWWNTVATVYKSIVDLGNGTTTNVMLVVGQPYGTLPTPKARAGYTFGGWYTGPNGTGTKITPTAIVQKNALGIYPHWVRQTYSVAFNANGGTGKMASQTIMKGVTAKLNANAFKRSGYTFIGWSKTKTGKIAYADKASVKDIAAAGQSVTLYAQWAVTNYKVAFNGNGGKLPKGKKMTALSMTYGKPKNLSANKFKREGYVFKGWAKSKKLAKKGKVAYKNKKKVKNLVTNGKTVKLYAVWKKK